MHLATVIRAMRPNFLVLPLLCVALGAGLVARQQLPTQPTLLMLLLLMAVLLHIAVNLLNEYEDFRSGLDLITQRTEFSGGSGALPDNPAAASWVLGAGIAALAITLLVGAHFYTLRGTPMLWVGLGAVVLVVTYTRWLTRSPLLCLLAPGLGFGPVIVLGTVLGLGGTADGAAWVAAIVVMLLVSELLLINQIPDIEADRRIGRRHLAIVLGPHGTSRLVAALLVAIYPLLALAWLAGLLPYGVWLTWLTLPATLWISWQLPQATAKPDALTRVLRVNVITLLVSLALLNIGVRLG